MISSNLHSRLTLSSKVEWEKDNRLTEKPVASRTTRPQAATMPRPEASKQSATLKLQDVIKRSHTWTMEARRINEDIYAWRKYGQKQILNSKFPRSYFRCTHKPTQGCNATKQVQKHEQDPSLFQITYIGHHTCNVSDETQAKTEPLDLEIVMDSDNNKLAATISQDHVDPYIQEQGNDISSLIGVGASMVKEEDYNNGDQNKDYCEGSSTYSDLSLVWPDVMMSDDRQHHQNHFYHGEASTTTSYQFSFIDNDQFSSLFDSYCPYEGTSAI
ncbi:hypothetical protein IGI04_010696 [Brassica rapa subsp. trilocularis]|uniref:WRKY domain-containing protein n=1 Tax=Brassica rapa subsp. trilocularis TaxID=1813537 RepID=A0ABQ7N0W9_BRACM|nr:hypothetical protein IGI04_010696 [Brassica rapa subsp. trilocularis]